MNWCGGEQSDDDATRSRDHCVWNVQVGRQATEGFCSAVGQRRSALSASIIELSAASSRERQAVEANRVGRLTHLGETASAFSLGWRKETSVSGSVDRRKTLREGADPLRSTYGVRTQGQKGRDSFN